ncbi:flagellar hook-length control protein FliK [Massilia cavernae]|nr:flagellar hook-length control protein FliK [Massilia cavernae]
MSVPGVGRVVAAIPALPVGDARQEAFERSLATQVGKALPVAVLAKLADGSFLVRVADQNARMALPPGTLPGTEVPMTLVSTQPRAAFQLTPGQGQLLHPTLIYQELGEARAPGAGALAAARANPGTAPGSAADAQGAQADPRNAQVSLSEAGRMLGRILASAQGQAGQPQAIQAATPLAGPGTPEPARLAQALEGAIAQSGLFYESHVAEWAEGKRALPELMREPQMQRALADAPAKTASAETDPAAAQLINQQLAAHEQGRVAWQGQVWPGQDMHWEIHKDAPEGGARGGDADAEPGWRSGLRLRFAGLGEIAATLVIAGDQLHIQLKAESGETSAVLRARAGELAAALGAAGSPLASLDISSAADVGGGDGR